MNVTQLLEAWSLGDREALDKLMPLVMGELKRIARAYLAREPHAQTLQATALVNEAYLRLVNVQGAVNAPPGAWQTRAQFFALSAQIMRRILVDHARAQLGPQRGGRRQQVPIQPELLMSPWTPGAVLSLDEALSSLEKIDPRKGRIVELRLFGGLSVEESAEALKISTRTVLRDWQFAKAWLARELNHVDASE